MVVAGAPKAAPGQRLADLSQAAHRSINRPPLFTIDPMQIVPIPLHLLLGITLLPLRLAVELVISCHCQDDGESFAYELAETLGRVVRVSPVPCHGGFFFGRHCHKIAEGRDAVCRTVLGLVLDYPHQAYKRLWLLWVRLGRILNRAAVVQADEIRQYRTDARHFLRLIKRRFPWVSVSSKLHILLHETPAFMERFGGMGLYGEQAAESWYGFSEQNAAKYTAQTEVKSCANLMRAMAVAQKASDSNLVRGPREFSE